MYQTQEHKRLDLIYLADMDSYYHTFHGLIRKRKRLAADVEGARRNMMDLKRDLAALDKALALFGHSDPKSIRTPGPYNRLFKRNELSRLLMAIKREQPDITEPEDLAREVIQRKGWDASNDQLFQMVLKRVRYGQWAMNKRQRHSRAAS